MSEDKVSRRCFNALVASVPRLLAAWGAETASKFSVGVNISCLEAGEIHLGQDRYPGTVHVDYEIPNRREIDYYIAKSIRMLRIPFRWERLQRTLMGELDRAYLHHIIDVVTHAHARGASCILDCHNYGRYAGRCIGDGTLSGLQLADLWSRIAHEFRKWPGVVGYDIMNEPYNLPDGADTWLTAAQVTIKAIRRIDRRTPIYVEGYQYASAARWTENNPHLHTLTDPANRLVFSAHCYLDRDNSGSHFRWKEETAHDITTDVGVQRMRDPVAWARTHGKRLHLGEIGAGNDDPGWLTALDATLRFCRDNGVAVTYWAGGPWWGEYGYSVAPRSDGSDAVQMAVLIKYS